MTTTTASPKLYRTLIDVPVVHAAAEADRQAFLDWAENEGIGHDRLVSVAFTDDRTSALVTRYDLKDGKRYTADGRTAATETFEHYVNEYPPLRGLRPKNLPVSASVLDNVTETVPASEIKAGDVILVEPMAGGCPEMQVVSYLGDYSLDTRAPGGQAQHWPCRHFFVGTHGIARFPHEPMTRLVAQR